MSVVIGNNNLNNVQVLQAASAAGGPPPPPSSIRSDTCCDKIKRCFKAAIDHFVDAMKHVTEFFAHAVATNDNIQSLCKFGKSTIAFFKYAFKAETQGFNNLQAELNIVDSALDVPDFIVDLKDWIIPKEDPADGKKKMFWNHKGITKWKIISKAVGTLSKGLGTFKFFFEIGLIKLARLSAFLNTIPFFRVLGEFSPLRLVKDSLSAISASLAVVDHGIGIHKKRKWMREEGNVVDLKLNKWKAKDKLRQYLIASDEQKQAILNEALKGQNVPVEEREQRYLQTLEDRYVRIRNDLIGRGVQPSRRNEGENVLAPAEKWEVVKVRYEDGNLKADNAKKCDAKMVQNATKLRDNGRVGQTKDWLGIAFQAVKVAAIIIGLVGLFVSALSGFVPFIIILSTAWFVTSSVGMARVYYGFKHRGKATVEN